MGSEFKEIALKAINKLYRTDPWVKAQYDAAGLSIEDVSIVLDEVFSNNYFDVAGTKAIGRYEKELGLNPVGSIDARRLEVENKWKSGGKVSLALLQSIISTYISDAIEIYFEDSSINFEFHSSNFIYAIKEIRAAIEEVKPAHLGFSLIDTHEVEGTQQYAIYITTGDTEMIDSNNEIASEFNTSTINYCGYVTTGNVVIDI